MIDLSHTAHHPKMEEIVSVLCDKTQNTDKNFFRAEVAYFLAKMASSQRATILTKDRGEIPVNMYALALASSGYGKGHSVNIMEQEILGGFKTRFIQDTLPEVAETMLREIADKRAVSQNLDQELSYQKVKAEYERQGAYPFTFDSATGPAIKQLRQRLLMSGAGSINLQIDEIGSNLLSNVEALNVFLELYDQGFVKMKLIKNTSENIRSEELDGKTPANMLLFGTPSKLLDGGDTEEQFYSFLETGYARRCLFGWGQQSKRAIHQMTPEEAYRRLIEPSNSQSIINLAAQFANLADPAMFNWKMLVEDAVGIQLTAYRMACELQAEQLGDHEEVKKAELNHRYFKALKLAGTYAFIDQSSEIEMEHLMQAILLVEESGQAFQKILSREKNYVKLAKYMAAVGAEVTHADLTEALPFYRQSGNVRNELMTLAAAYGYKNHIQIKKRFDDGLEFFQAETLEATDLNKLILSHSNSYAYDYEFEEAPFDEFHVLASSGREWTNHRFLNGHRAEENVVTGFNVIVLDIDEGKVTWQTAAELMKEYKFFLHTTKSHTDDNHRFRMVLPISYVLHLDADEYKEFMQNVLAWLPFTGLDKYANQRSRKWATHPNCQVYYNVEGGILDARRFIPKTAKNEQYQQEFKAIANFDNLERWFAQRISMGNRNNQLIRFALALVDSQLPILEVRKRVFNFNAKLSDPLRKDELEQTVMQTVGKRYTRQGKATA